MQGILDVPYGSRRVMPQPALLFTFKMEALISLVCCARLWAWSLALGLLSLTCVFCLFLFNVFGVSALGVRVLNIWSLGFCVWASEFGLQFLGVNIWASVWACHVWASGASAFSVCASRTTEEQNVIVPWPLCFWRWSCVVELLALGF